MPQAKILVDGVPGAGLENIKAIASLVQLDNDNIGGETTFDWAIMDQPDLAPADALSNPAIQNPTITINKEGTYRFRLVVNQGAADEKTDFVLVSVLQVKSLNRVPAFSEDEDDAGATGWKSRTNALLRAADDIIADNLTKMVVEAAANVAQGDVVFITGVATIKAGLPGEERVFTMDKALATNPGDIDGLLAVVEENVDGTTAVLTGELMQVRITGLFSQLLAGAATVGDPIFVSDTGAISLAPGTNTRELGKVASTPTGATFRAAINGGFFLPLATVAPADVDKSAAATGASSDAARADHKHDISTAVVSDVGVANAEGGGTALARAAHVHRGQILLRATLLMVSDATTTSGVFVTLLGPLAFTLTDGFIDFLMTVSASNSTNNTTIDFRVLIDGSPVTLGVQLGIAAGAGTGQSGAVQFSANFGPGPHTITIQWRTSAGTARIRFLTAADTEHVFARILETTL